MFALALVLVVWSSAQKNSKEIYSASLEPAYLEVEAVKTDNGDLADWEKEILDRKTAPALTRVNYTEAVSRSVLEEYFRAKDAKAFVNEDDIAKNIIRLNSLENQGVEYKKYSISDLKITPRDDQETLKKYGNKLGEASIKNAYDTKYGSEFEIFTKAMQFSSIEEFKKLEPIIESYQNLLKDLLKIETPANLATIHLGIINSISGLQESLNEISIFTDDPFRGFFVMTTYAKYSTELQSYMKELNTFMKNNGVIFDENEAGYSIEKAAEISLPQN